MPFKIRVLLRLLVLTVALAQIAFLASPASATITLVSHTKTSPAGSSGGTTPAINATGANLLVATVVVATAANPCGAVSDSSGNTWTCLNQYSNSFNRIAILYVLNPTVSSSQTFTIAASNSTVEIAAFSGIKTSSAFDVQNGLGNGSGSTFQPGSVTPSQNNSLFITTLGMHGTAVTASIDSGFIVTDQNPTNGSYYGSALAYFIQGTAVAENPTWSTTLPLTFGPTSIAVFKGAPTPPGGSGFIHSFPP